ncbi:MAG: TlpA disulfide reductase family protein [Balneolaceae bacterium]|nr:TlpA disulfide reductase family protein [Balneolaceae bacterium]
MQESEPLLKDVNAEELERIIDSFAGEKAVLINVWATWCAPCIEEFPEIVRIQRKYKDRLRVVFISADFPDSRNRARQFLKEQGVDWTTYFKTGSDQEFIETLSKEWTGALPFTKILDRQGEAVASWENSATFSKFERHVKQALNH